MANSRGSKASLLFSVALALAGTAGCIAEKGAKFGDTNAFCNGRGEAECNAEVILSCAVSDKTHCVASRQAACVAAIPTGTSYNSDAAEACINAVAGAFGDAKVSADENNAIGEACGVVFDGTAIVNAACQADIDCKVSAGLRCVQTGGLATGTCQVPQIVQGGGHCTAPNQQCAKGFHCGPSQSCDVDSLENEACGPAVPCVSTARCVGGVCTKKNDDGTACASDAECLHGLCARGSGAAQGLCASQLTLAPNEPFCEGAR
jgi:hypothetical protein